MFIRRGKKEGKQFFCNFRMCKVAHFLVLFALTHVKAEESRACSDFTATKDNQYRFKDPENCRKFFICIDGKVQHFECNAGTSFNPETVKCDGPRSGYIEGCFGDSKSGSFGKESVLLHFIYFYLIRTAIL